MLYLNFFLTSKFLFPLNLTLTSVVFEFFKASICYISLAYLTLTSVVFEFHKNKSPFGDLFYLTLTSVVFEYE